MIVTAELLMMVLDGDGPSIQAIKDMFAGRMHTLIQSYKLIHEDYDDIFQEFIIRVFSNGTLNFLLVSKHPTPTQVLYSVLKQVVIDRVRYWSSEKRTYAREEQLDEKLEESLEWSSSSDAIFEVDLSDLLDSHLSQGELDLVDLIAGGDRIKNIAEHYGVNVSTASRWCIRLGIKLRRLLHSSSNFT
jgi:DNA-directed RNA polymerase specialized sigma24 family protein